MVLQLSESPSLKEIHSIGVNECARCDEEFVISRGIIRQLYIESDFIGLPRRSRDSAKMIAVFIQTETVLVHQRSARQLIWSAFSRRRKWNQTCPREFGANYNSLGDPSRTRSHVTRKLTGFRLTRLRQLKSVAAVVTGRARPRRLQCCLLIVHNWSASRTSIVDVFSSRNLGENVVTNFIVLKRFS